MKSRSNRFKKITLEMVVVTEQGLRPEMEDAHFIDPNFGGKGWVFAGVYDGHGGGFAAQYAAENLHRIFLDQLLAGSDPKTAFVAAYEQTSESLAGQESGTTAVTCLIKEGKIFAANVGDARAIVIKDNGVKQLTVDHRLDNPAESQRIEEMGGLIRHPYVYRDNRGLMPTRTLGDQYFKSVGVIAAPSVSEYEIAKGDITLLLGCDGLFDIMTNEEVAAFAREFREPDALANELKDEVLVSRLGGDNLTMVAVSLGR